MVYFSWGSKVLALGTAKEVCENCNKERVHEFVLVYRIMGLYYLFSVVVEKKYYWRCTGCNAEGDADGGYCERTFPNVRIPILDRFGCIIFVIGFALILCLIVTLANRQ